MSGEQWGEAVDAARHAVGLNLHDATRAIAAAAPLIVADTRRKVAEELLAERRTDISSRLTGRWNDAIEHAAAIARGSGNGGTA